MVVSIYLHEQTILAVTMQATNSKMRVIVHLLHLRGVLDGIIEIAQYVSAIALATIAASPSNHYIEFLDESVSGLLKYQPIQLLAVMS